MERYPTFVLQRMPLGLLNGVGPMPVTSGWFWSGSVRETFGLGGGVERRLHRRVLGMIAEPPRDDGAFGAVEVAAEVSICLQLAEEGQHLLVAPLVVAERSPAIVVLRHSP